MASLSLNGGNKLGELELLAADQLLSKLILWLKGLFSFLSARELRRHHMCCGSRPAWRQ